MAVVPMQKIRLYVHSEHASEVLRAVQKVGVVHFEEVTVGTDELTTRQKEAFEFNYASSRLDFAVRFLSKFETPATGLRAMVEGTKVRTTGTALYETVNSFDYNTVIEAAQDIERSIVESQTRVSELEAERALLTPWLGLQMPLATGRETARTVTLFVAGARGEASHTDLARLCAEADIVFHTSPASDTHQAYVVLRHDVEAFTRLLAELSCEIVSLPLRRGTPAEELERIGRAIQSQQEDIARAESRARELTSTLPELRTVSDYMLWQKEKHDLLSGARSSAEVVVFEGWCPISDLTLVEERIKNKTPAYALEQIEPVEGETPPVEIRNHPFFAPFETVTRLYGLPGHMDLDPTAYLAGFFFLFFGLALSDLGYGLIMVAGIGYILWRYRVPKSVRPMLLLMFAGGVSTVVVGALYGGYFGVSMDFLPDWVQALQLFDPIKNPMPVFYLALALGIVQIVVGLVLYILSEARNGRLVSGLWERGPWIGFFVMASALLGAKLGFVPGPAVMYEYAVYVCLALIVGYAAYAEANWLLKPVKGVLSLYDIVAYFSDMLSYSRLLALGLATSALAYAVNLIAVMVKDVPYVGLIFMAAILIVGHLFNLALNILGAFIHSARLQFVEFFGKFVQGSGRVYAPFKRQERYVELVEP